MLLCLAVEFRECLCLAGEVKECLLREVKEYLLCLVKELKEWFLCLMREIKLKNMPMIMIEYKWGPSFSKLLNLLFDSSWH